MMRRAGMRRTDCGNNGSYNRYLFRRSEKVAISGAGFLWVSRREQQVKGVYEKKVAHRRNLASTSPVAQWLPPNATILECSRRKG